MRNTLKSNGGSPLATIPCYGIGGGFGEIRKGQKPVRYELVKRIAVSTPPLYHNSFISATPHRISSRKIYFCFMTNQSLSL